MRLLPFAIGLTVVAAAACADNSGAGPDPLRPERYQLQFVNNNSLPIILMSGLFPGDVTLLDSAVLVPYAVGRTIDRRLVNDRTGRGSTGGSTRDTTVARGQFMDIKVIKHVTASAGGTISFQRDSTLVDVEIRDTVVIVLRDHPGASQVQVDTGYFSGDLLVLPTVMRRVMGQVLPAPRSMILSYKLTR